MLMLLLMQLLLQLLLLLVLMLLLPVQRQRELGRGRGGRNGDLDNIEHVLHLGFGPDLAEETSFLARRCPGGEAGRSGRG